jgi:hypothetical protein
MSGLLESTQKKLDEATLVLSSHRLLFVPPESGDWNIQKLYGGYLFMLNLLPRVSAYVEKHWGDPQFLRT